MKQILCLLALLLAPVVNATQVVDLYTATVKNIHSDDNGPLLERAYASAAQEVLVRVSGQVSAMDNELLAKVRQQASSWVAQHSVENKEVSVTFYPESIDRFLYQSNLPVWGANRPSVLVWMIEETDKGRVTYGSDRAKGLLSQFFEQAKSLGLPVFAPLADQSDLQTVSSSELWGFFQEDIRAASQRYETDVVLVIRIGEYDSQYAIDGLLLYPEQTLRLPQQTSSSKREGVANMANALARSLSDRYASTRAPGDEGVFQVQVEGVNDYSTMIDVTNYLKGMGVVRQVQLEKMMDNSVQFALTLDGSVQKFRNSVALNTMLRLKPVSALDPQANRITILELSR